MKREDSNVARKNFRTSALHLATLAPCQGINIYKYSTRSLLILESTICASSVASIF
jgi:hypothetical protein